MEAIRKDADDLDIFYEQATVAFLRGDKPALLKARADLAATPEPAWWGKVAAGFKRRTGHDITWPTNLNVVDGLVACFGKPYAVAYDCRPKSVATPLAK
jgi:hypothetical protein